MKEVTVHSSNITQAFATAGRWLGEPAVLVHTSQAQEDGAYDFRFAPIAKRAA